MSRSRTESWSGTLRPGPRLSMRNTLQEEEMSRYNRDYQGSDCAKSVTQIENRKLNWNTESRIRSLDNHSHKPGGGDKKIENRKLDWNVESRIGSTKNLKHKAGGGNIQVAKT